MSFKIAFIDTYYPKYLKSFYKDKSLTYESSYDQLNSDLLASNFGTSDFYSKHLNNLGIEAKDFIVNDVVLQRAWAKQHGFDLQFVFEGMPSAIRELPIIGHLLASIDDLPKVAIAQIEEMQPDIVYCQDLWFFSPEQLKKIKTTCKLLVGQIASPLPADQKLRHFDLILTSFPHFIPNLMSKGIRAEYFPIAFEKSMWTQNNTFERDLPLVFVGGISRHHAGAYELLEFLSENAPIQIYGYGIENVPSSSPIRKVHRGEAWGDKMYQILARSKICLNRHIDVSENYANNMRLYEATGMGAMLLTDKKDNLSSIFDINTEVVTYSSKEEAVEKVKYYLANENCRIEIAQSGQKRTLQDYNYFSGMVSLKEILKRHLSEISGVSNKE